MTQWQREREEAAQKERPASCDLGQGHGSQVMLTVELPTAALPTVGLPVAVSSAGGLCADELLTAALWMGVVWLTGGWLEVKPLNVVLLGGE